LYAAGVTASIADGIARAERAIGDGSARARLDQFVAATQALSVRPA
jgi:anthranilate phosphoribosyltransferase